MLDNNKEQQPERVNLTRREALSRIFSTLTVVPLAPSLLSLSALPSQNSCDLELNFTSPVGKDKKLPEDIVPKEELTERGVLIWNIDDIKLHLRREALEQEPIFQQLAKHPSLGLDIVLVDGDSVKSYYLTREQRAGMPEVASLLEGQEEAPRIAQSQYFLNNQDAKRKEYEEELAQLERRISRNNWDIHAAKVERRALIERYRPFLYGPTLEDLNPGGVQTMMIDSPSMERRRALIAMRDPDAVVFFSGTVRLRVADPQTSRALAEDQSFPSVDYFRNSFERKNIVALAPGLALRHLLAKLSQPTNPENMVISRLAAAEQAYTQNQDDSLYYLAFETPLFVVTT